jgi:hypothetical protein
MKKSAAVAASIAALVATVWGTQAFATSSNSASLVHRVKVLETKVAALRKRVAKVEARQACVHSYAGVTSQGDTVNSGYLFQTLTGSVEYQPALLHWPYANAPYRFALVESSCRWPSK